ncbi:ribosomal L14e-domain-containing protein [Chaetoceros tenuissimus]|uniref:Ribosomal L14e-domain-containing protein n=1 Tax=Chaetoceros tenuissimus TaxID=426638 RepID=A0AAD3H8E1_9STRA|nr:ribosomal L14e-domain-containing protein [Chaetoceros tenuissimus]
MLLRLQIPTKQTRITTYSILKGNDSISSKKSCISFPSSVQATCVLACDKMVFKRYVEVGRVVLVNYGPDAGKLATIVDIVDQNKCLIEGPANLTGVERQVISYGRIALTDLKVKIGRNARQKTLNAAWAAADIQAKWDGSSWAKKLAAKSKRASLSDFDRFKVMVARKQKSSIIAKKMAELSA